MLINEYVQLNRIHTDIDSVIRLQKYVDIDNLCSFKYT